MSTQACRINIAEELSSDLAFRDIATSFMNRIESLDHPVVIIDFRVVESITRSFAHEYVSRRDRSDLEIQELNVPRSVLQMFTIINNSERKPRFEELKNADVISI